MIAVIVFVSHNGGPSATCSGSTQESTKDYPGSTVKPAGEDYISTNGKPFPYHNIRLPNSVTPFHYSIFLHPNISNSVFEGTVTISCRVAKDTNFIVLHVKDLNIQSIEAKNEDTVEKLDVKEYLIYDKNEQLYIGMGSQLKAQMNFSLVIKYSANLTTDLKGFYKSVYKNNAGEER